MVAHPQFPGRSRRLIVGVYDFPGCWCWQRHPIRAVAQHATPNTAGCFQILESARSVGISVDVVPCLFSRRSLNQQPVRGQENNASSLLLHYTAQPRPSHGRGHGRVGRVSDRTRWMLPVELNARAGAPTKEWIRAVDPASLHRPRSDESCEKDSGRGSREGATRHVLHPVHLE